MVLIDDPDRSVIEPLFEKDLSRIYDFELNAGGGMLKDGESLPMRISVLYSNRLES